MIELVLGTPDSGKSLFAEKRAGILFEELEKKEIRTEKIKTEKIKTEKIKTEEIEFHRKKIYLATMQPYGKEGERRIQKHRAMREGKGFETIECSDSLERILPILRKENSKNVILLECMSNLCGNEMYLPKNQALSEEDLAALILEEVALLSTAAEHLILVANQFPLEDPSYDEETKKYVRLILNVNQKLKTFSDCYYEKEKGEWIRYEDPS